MSRNYICQTGGERYLLPKAKFKGKDAIALCVRLLWSLAQKDNEKW
jgi:hypothetical protein